MNITAVFRPQTVLAAAMGAVLLIGAILPADAQIRSNARQAQREQAKAKAKEGAAGPAAQTYPEATRKEPESRASAQQARKLQKLVDLYEEDNSAEALALAAEIINAPKANAYDKSFAAQTASQVAYGTDDTAATMAYLAKALEFDGLDNNGHYGAMLMLAQLQMQEEQYELALTTLNRLMEETRVQKPEHLALKGNSLYRLERYPEAAEALKQAIAGSPEPKADWTQLLMATYFDSGQSAEAARLAEEIAGKNPADKRAQMNLSAAYLQIEAYDKAAAVLEKLRAAGQLTEDREYRQLYSTYLNIDGKEREAAEVIADGLQKGVLQPGHDTYLALGQAYYFSDQPGPAIEAYKKAAPLAKDGETYLNLAKLLWQEDKVAEAKSAAREAMAKGLKNSEDAKKIIALPGG